MNDNVNKKYIAEVSPVFLGAIGMALYYFTDGLFIGNALGDDGMSAITISWTIVTLLTAIANGIGAGGSIRYSVALGQKDETAVKNYYFGTIILLALVSVLFTIILVVFYKDILVLLGASSNVLKYSEDYCQFVAYGVVFQVFGIGALPLVRNMGGYKLASIAMGAGYVLNFILDYVLMVLFPFGMTGCSIAYISGQILVAALCVIFLLKEYRNHFAGERISINFMHTFSGILVTGLAPFGLYFSQNVVSVFVNKGFIDSGGSEALACYTVVIYIAGITNTLHRAIMEGSQPIMSRYYGEGNTTSLRRSAEWMYLCSGILIALGALITFIFKIQIADLFGVSDMVAANVTIRLPLYLIGYTFICYSRTTISYFSATDKKLRAGILTYAEPATMLIMVTLLPIWFGENGMWTAIILVYTLMALTAKGLMLIKRKKL